MVTRDAASDDFPLTTDPFKYRLMELVGVYGDALRERARALRHGSSAVDLRREAREEGRARFLTIDAKFVAALPQRFPYTPTSSIRRT